MKKLFATILTLGIVSMASISVLAAESNVNMAPEASTPSIQKFIAEETERIEAEAVSSLVLENGKEIELDPEITLERIGGLKGRTATNSNPEDGVYKVTVRAKTKSKENVSEDKDFQASLTLVAYYEVSGLVHKIVQEHYSMAAQKATFSNRLIQIYGDGNGIRYKPSSNSGTYYVEKEGIVNRPRLWGGCDLTGTGSMKGETAKLTCEVVV